MRVVALAFRALAALVVVPADAQEWSPGQRKV